MEPKSKIGLNRIRFKKKMVLKNQGNVSQQKEQKAQIFHISMKLHAYAISCKCVTKKVQFERGKKSKTRAESHYIVAFSTY